MKSHPDQRTTEFTGTESSMSGFVDLHMHVLPGIDDGPTDMATSLDMLRAAVEGGTSAVCATPHVGGSELDKDVLYALVAELNAAAQKEEIPVHVFPGAEYQLDEWMIGLADNELLIPLGKSRNILVELPFTQIPAIAWKILFEIQARGYRVVVAHPERNAEIQQSSCNIAGELVRRGCLLQVSGSSLTGEHGKLSRKTALVLMAHGLCDAVASDSHAPTGGRGPSLAKAYGITARRFDATLATNLFSDWPLMIVSSVD